MALRARKTEYELTNREKQILGVFAYPDNGKDSGKKHTDR
jgi:hypothetical protein